MEKFKQIRNYVKTVSQNDFYRQTLISMSCDDNSPEDILTAQFGKITETQKDFLYVEADVEIDYSLSVGYDKKVETYDRNKQQYVTKTITEWQPFNGHNSSQEACIMPNNTNDHDDVFLCNLFSKATSTTKSENVKLLDDDAMSVDIESLEIAKKSMIDDCFNKVKLPGDRQKDKKHSGIATVTDLIGARTSLYKTEYTYLGKKYDSCGFSCGKPETMTFVPSLENETSKEASKKVMPYTIAGVATIILGIILFVITAMNSGGDTIFTFLSLLPVVVGVIILSIGKKKKYEHIQQANYLRKQAKLAKLTALLASKKLAPLTANERSLFNK